MADSNAKTATTVQEEVIKERQATVRRFGRHCLQSLDHFLQNGVEGWVDV